MKRFIPLALAAVVSLPVFAVDYSDDEVLHATFAAFQEPGVFSADYIAGQRALLVDAASAGNPDARRLLERHRQALGGETRHPPLVMEVESPH